MQVRIVAAAALVATLAGCGGVVSREYLAPEKMRREIRSAAVLPLENLTAMQDAGKIVSDVLSTELASHSVTVVDRARAEASLGKMDMVSGGTVDRIAAQRLGEILGVDAVVYGSIAEAADGTARPGPRHADVGLTVRVLDVKTGGYLLAGSYTATSRGDSITGAAHRAADRIAKAVGK